MSARAKLWKELRYLSADEWIKKMWSIYTMEYYSAIRKDEYPTFLLTYILAALNNIRLDGVKRRATCTPMFIAAMSTIAKLSKELRYLLTDEGIKKM